MEGAMVLTWLGAGAAVGSLLTYRLVNSLLGHEKDENLRAYKVENEALSRTNSIYRERIEQLENILFSNDKYLEMVGEIERLSVSNFKLRSRLKDLECLVEAEKKKNTRERVEQLEKTVRELQQRLEKERNRTETAAPVEILPARPEIAAAAELPPGESERERSEPKKWATVLRARKM